MTRDDPTPQPRPRQRPRALIWLITIQGIWLIGASAGRVIIMLTGDGRLDALPFIGCSLGIISIFIVTSLNHRH